MKNKIKFGCQTYAWYMSYEKYKDDFSSVIDVIGNAGYEGVETSTYFLDNKNEAKVKKSLKDSGIQLAAYGLGLDWLNDSETDKEYKIAQKTIELVKNFPGTLLMLSHDPKGNRNENLKEKQRRQIGIVNAVARRAKEAGLQCAYHANSADNALFRTEEDYYHLVELLDTSVIGLAPDIGHMANGNCNIIKMLIEFAPIIRHVHYKDMNADHSWAPMGCGIIDYKQVTDLLYDMGYDGWVMVEDESLESEKNADRIAYYNEVYIEHKLRRF